MSVISDVIVIRGIRHQSMLYVKEECHTLVMVVTVYYRACNQLLRFFGLQTVVMAQSRGNNKAPPQLVLLFRAIA
jgi:hypothetical protein